MPGPVGREAELTALREFLAAPSARALVLTGGPGIGKTTLWEAAIDAARADGMRVVLARPNEAEARHSFAALADLFDGVELGAVPGPQRAALEVALLRAEPGGAAPEPHAITLGALNALRGLGASLVVAIDDVQWLDAASADALAFAARRLAGEPVRFLLARRPGRRSTLELALERGALRRLEVAPLGLEAIRRLLVERLGLRVSRPVLQRIVAATLGNPLFALEQGRVLQERGEPAVGEEIPVPENVEALLGTRVAALPEPLRRALLAVALGGDLRTDALAAIVGRDAVDDALDDGLLLADGDRLRPSHPLLAAVARSRSRRRERRELHRALADVVADDELRARHLALAAERPDAALAETVAQAAAGASAHGAAAVAVELAEQALRLTPPDAPVRAERVLALAGYLETTGARQRVTALLRPELDTLPPGRARVRAWLLLSEGGEVDAYADVHRHLARALAEAGDDPALRAPVLATLALRTAAEGVERMPEAEAWAVEALPESADPEAERLALRGLGWARSLRGRPIDDLCDRFDAVSERAAHIVDCPEPVAGLRLLWRGDIEPARENIARFLALADERGEAVSYAWLRLNACELELRTGEWEAVERRLDEWADSGDRNLLIAPTYRRCRALLAAGRGDAAAAEGWAAPALAEAEALGYRWQVLESHRALGTAALLAHDPGTAVGHLRTVWDYTVREGIDEPGAFPVAADLVEALVETGGDPRPVTTRLRALAEEQEHPWGLATAARCAALTQLGAAPDEAAAAALSAAAETYAELGLRPDAARTLLSLGRAQRRHRKWGAARDALGSAAAAFDALGSEGWAERARAELERVGARRPAATGELTATERRVVELAADGLANKEIASALFVSVRTVEAHLTNAYAKLGVRGRAQLAPWLAGQAASEDTVPAP